ncbi:MAG: diguanylate cyclase [Oscillospiraceae bacterium]|jgi:diguanylate cyclase (GGDEF)-like protein|nr:diguanylate cyclase [Oscillospiraceae bacterium]
MSEIKKNSILIVDDDNSNVLALAQILSPDYTIYAAKNGRGAVRAAEKHLPDIILLDIVMPEMDGYAVIEALKKSNKTKEIPVIFVTALGSTGDEAWGLSLGAADYITKPFFSGIVKLRVQNQIKILEQMRTIERFFVFDQLTGLPSKRNLLHRIEKEWKKALKKNKMFNISIINVDNIEKYDDIYGYEQVDAALKEVAEILTGTLERTSDFAARWSDEEFVLLLPDSNAKEVLGIAELIQRNVENILIPVPGGTNAKLTVSIGVNIHEKLQSDITKNEFIEQAYEMLNKAKDSGGNQIYYNHKEERSSI